MAKLVIISENIKKSMSISKDFRNMGKGELAQFIAELELAKRTLLNKLEILNAKIG